MCFLSHLWWLFGGTSHLTGGRFADLDITYDRNSNITLIEDHILLSGSSGRFDVEYTLDDRDRLTNAEEGHWNGSTISTTTREQKWTELSQTGNWDRVKLDLDGDGSFTGTDEYDDSRTHNVVNELTARDTDTDSTDDFTLTYDEVGNLIDDGEHYEYVFDVFGRLRRVKDTSDQSTVAEYEYNGLGYRITWHYDADADGDVDSNDPVYRFVYDDRWRIVATYRGTATTSDSDPKEQFVYHNAGNDGRGGASYIDDVILRDKDANTSWTAASDGTLEERIDYCQNWRHDVVALVDSAGGQVEQGRYFSYGIPFGLPAGDIDSDGDVDVSDPGAFDSLAAYEARADLDLDGVNDSSDRATIVSNDGDALGAGQLSLAVAASRRGYAGYELDDALDASMCHVRNRVLHAAQGRWSTRDHGGCRGAASLYEYVGSHPNSAVDPSGLAQDPGAMTKAECETKVMECLMGNLARPLLAALRECWQAPGMWPPFVCSECGQSTDPRKPPGRATCGTTRPPWKFRAGSPERYRKYGLMRFCYDNCPGDIRSCSTVLHELRHMLSACLTENRDRYPDALPKGQWDTKEGCFILEKEGYCAGGQTDCCGYMFGEGRCQRCCESICGSCAQHFEYDYLDCEFECKRYFG